MYWWGLLWVQISYRERLQYLVLGVLLLRDPTESQNIERTWDNQEAPLPGEKLAESTVPR